MRGAPRAARRTDLHALRYASREAAQTAPCVTAQLVTATCCATPQAILPRGVTFRRVRSQHATEINERYEVRRLTVRVVRFVQLREQHSSRPLRVLRRATNSVALRIAQNTIAPSRTPPRRSARRTARRFACRAAPYIIAPCHIPSLRNPIDRVAQYIFASSAAIRQSQVEDCVARRGAAWRGVRLTAPYITHPRHSPCHTQPRRAARRATYHCASCGWVVCVASGFYAHLI